MKKIALLLLVAMAACTEIPLQTRTSLENLDLMTADVSDMRFVVEQSADLPLKTTATLSVGMTTPEGKIGETYILASTALPVTENGQLRSTFMIAESDRPKINALRANIAQLQAQYPDASNGSVSIGASGCLTAAAPTGPMLVTVYVGLAGQSGLMPLITDMDIQTLSERPIVYQPGSCR